MPIFRPNQSTHRWGVQTQTHTPTRLLGARNEETPSSPIVPGTTLGGVAREWVQSLEALPPIPEMTLCWRWGRIRDRRWEAKVGSSTIVLIYQSKSERSSLVAATNIPFLFHHLHCNPQSHHHASPRAVSSSSVHAQTPSAC